MSKGEDKIVGLVCIVDANEIETIIVVALCSLSLFFHISLLLVNKLFFCMSNILLLEFQLFHHYRL